MNTVFEYGLVALIALLAGIYLYRHFTKPKGGCGDCDKCG